MFFKILSTSLINVNEIRKNKSKEQKKNRILLQVQHLLSLKVQKSQQREENYKKTKKIIKIKS